MKLKIEREWYLYYEGYVYATKSTNIHDRIANKALIKSGNIFALAQKFGRQKRRYI